MHHRQQEDAYVIRFERGEDIIAALARFLDAQGVANCAFSAIGAVNELELAMFMPQDKQYHTRTFREDLEIASLSGNAFPFEGKAFVHAHGVFGRKDFSAIAGHVNRAVVSVTCEMIMRVLPTTLQKSVDDDTALKFISF